MFQLNESQTCSISAGYEYEVYVTQEWKDTQAMYSGVAGGVFGSVLGGVINLLSSFSLMTGANVVVSSGILGYFLGYYASYGLKVISKMILGITL